MNSLIFISDNEKRIRLVISEAIDMKPDWDDHKKNHKMSYERHNTLTDPLTLKGDLDKETALKYVLELLHPECREVVRNFSLQSQITLGSMVKCLRNDGLDVFI